MGNSGLIFGDSGLVCFLVLLFHFGYELFELATQVTIVLQTRVGNFREDFGDLLLLSLDFSLLQNCCFFSFLSLVDTGLDFFLRLSLLTLVSVDEFTGYFLFTGDALQVKLLSHTVWVKSGLAVWALFRFFVQVENLLTDTDWFEFWQQLVACCCSCLTSDVPLSEEEVV